MAKKSFKDNPALNFITKTEIDESKEDAEKKNNKRTESVPMKPNPLYVETRSKRLNLLIQPSLYAKVKKIANTRDKSMNDLIHNILEEYTNK